MLTQIETYQLFHDIDRHPDIMRPRIGRWCAWPMAKMQLVWHLMHVHEQTARSRMSLVEKAVKKLPRAVAGTISALLQSFGPRQSGDAIGLLYVPRTHRFPDETVRDFLYGDLLTGAGLEKPIVALEYPPQGLRAPRPPNVSPVDLRSYYYASEQLAVMLMASRRLRALASRLNTMLDGFAVPLVGADRRKKILLALALFEARRWVMKRVFRRLKLGALVVTYAPGRYAEIAAARELGMPVVELQHGVIGSRCPDYAWPAAAIAHRQHMPLPDAIGVFGETFRSLIVQSGFWRSGEVVPIGAAAIDVARACMRPVSRPKGSLRLIFMTQGTNKTAALDFWQRFSEHCKARCSDVEVVFKVHPEEQANLDDYRTAAVQAGVRFSIAGAEINPLEAMLAADIVISYNSMALIEALAIGRPAISICGGAIPKGFCGSFGLEGIEKIMPHVTSPDGLLDLLESAAGDPRRGDWLRRSETTGREYFSTDFSANAARLINEVTARAHASA